MVDPDDLVIITDKSDPLYDPRVELPVEEPMVLNIMHKGILQNIRIVRRNNQDVVITGRQRVKAAREANKRLRKEGKEPIKVPCVLTRGDEAEQLGVMISENELRQGDGILAKAEKCKRYLDMGRTEKEAAIVFGVTVQTIKNWMEIIGLSAAVKKAVDSGIISATAAAKLSGLSPAEQKEKLDKLIKDVSKPGKRRISINKATKAAGKPIKAIRAKKEIEDALEYSENEWVKATLRWVLCQKDSISLE